MMASSAARWRVCSTRRTFSRATLRLAASVVQEFEVGVAEGILVVQVLERDEATRLDAHREGHEEDRPGLLAGERLRAHLPAHARHVAVDQDRLTRLEEPPTEPGRRPRVDEEAIGPLVDVGEGHGLGGAIEHPDHDDLGVEDLAHLVADEVVHRLHVELGGQALLDAVDDGQFRRALVRLAEQPLRLVEQAGVLQRRAEARRDRGEQPHVPVVEGVLAVQVLQ